MRRAVGLGLLAAATMVIAASLIQSGTSVRELTELREAGNRLQQRSVPPWHGPPQLVPPRAPGPGVTA